MSTPCFYCPDLDVKVAADDKQIVALPELEASHAARARRLRVGDTVNLLNGKGGIASGEIHRADKRHVDVKVMSFEYIEKTPNRLAIATAIPKGDRQKVMIDMLTQLGVADVFPLMCEHSVTRYSSNLGEKWQRSAVEACKQSRNPWLPIIHEGLTVEALCGRNDYSFVYADGQGGTMAQAVEQARKEALPLLVMVGPEGGFSNAETQFFTGQEIPSLALGPVSYTHLTLPTIYSV